VQTELTKRESWAIVGWFSAWSQDPPASGIKRPSRSIRVLSMGRTPWSLERVDGSSWRSPNRRGLSVSTSHGASVRKRLRQDWSVVRANHLTLRATEGFARSLVEVMRLDLPVPDSSTLCRRAKTVRITLPKNAAGPLHLVLDSTGLKVSGEGEWKVRQHGYSKRRTWLKLHRAIDPQTHEIQAAMVSEPG
jgi:Transposase DDE domain